MRVSLSSVKLLAIAPAIETDAERLAPLSVGGKPPISGLQVTVEEGFLHCGRSLIRSRLWDLSVQIERSSYPSYGQVRRSPIWTSTTSTRAAYL